jgi:glucosamine-6-phosphate deaminase
MTDKSYQNSIEIGVYHSPEELGTQLAVEILSGITEAQQRNQGFVLGCPGGRSLRSTYQALGRLISATDLDLSHLIIAMMDDYVIRNGDDYQHCPEDAHYSCRRFAREEIVKVLNIASASGKKIPDENVWFPDPAEPEFYDQRLQAAGGIDIFLIASGASDGHVAFNPPGSSIECGTRIIRLQDTTRTDNMKTFPMFDSLEEVPQYGVSVGLATITELSKRVILVLTGSDKRYALKTIIGSREFTSVWPASVIYRCRNASIWLDSDTATGIPQAESVA